MFLSGKLITAISLALLPLHPSPFIYLMLKEKYAVTIIIFI
jgi:hypothetical protein